MDQNRRARISSPLRIGSQRRTRFTTQRLISVPHIDEGSTQSRLGAHRPPIAMHVRSHCAAWEGLWKLYRHVMSCHVTSLMLLLSCLTNPVNLTRLLPLSPRPEIDSGRQYIGGGPTRECNAWS
jgi:hypothetical protein